MRFINPKTDFAFKKIFGSAQSKAILISFLNALLYQERPIIQDLEIIDPYLAPKIEGVKDTFVDVRARLQDGRTVIIEMQVLNVEGFEKRVLYNAAKAYSTQLLVGESYRELSAVIALTITDFVMFPEWPEVESAFVLKEKERLTDYPEGDLELVFVELPKFKKGLEELVGVKDKWLYFLRRAPDLEVIPDAMEAVPEIKEAFVLANIANMSREELELQERKMMFIMDQRGAVMKAEKEGLAKGLEQGLAKGLEQGLAKGLEQGLAKGLEQGLAKGLEQGLAQGREEMAREIARRLLGQLSDQQIADITGLSLAEIAALRIGD